MNKQERGQNVYFTINPGTKISVIKEEFNHLFPFLKLEFFKHKHAVHAVNPKSDIINNDFTLSEIKHNASFSNIKVTEETSVAALEQLFLDAFGLSAQVFRKSGRSWLETSVTDDWTLKRQNDEGKELSLFTRH